MNKFISMRILLTGFSLLSLMSLSTTSSFSSESNIETLIESCAVCHNAAGPVSPNLAGQKRDYMIERINIFRDKPDLNVSMFPFVQNLSDSEIEAIAEHFSSLESVTSANGDAEKVKRGEQASAYCLSCHGVKGKSANSEWPNLAGQNSSYLYQQLKAFRDGTRDNLMMKTIVKDYDDEYLKALASYYSQLKP
jgi:cytochrome c553